MWAYFIPMLATQITLCVLALIKALQMASAEYATPRVVVVLLRDTMVYYGSILALYVINEIIWTVARVSSHVL